MTLRVCMRSHSVVSSSFRLHGLHVAHQAPLSMGFSRQEYWSELPFPSPGDLPNPASNLGLPHCRQILYQLSHKGSPLMTSSKGNYPYKAPPQTQWLWGKGFHIPVFGGHRHWVQAPGKKIWWSLLPWGIPDPLAKVSSQWGKVP